MGVERSGMGNERWPWGCADASGLEECELGLEQAKREVRVGGWILACLQLERFLNEHPEVELVEFGEDASNCGDGFWLDFKAHGPRTTAQEEDWGRSLREFDASDGSPWDRPREPWLVSEPSADRVREAVNSVLGDDSLYLEAHRGEAVEKLAQMKLGADYERWRAARERAVLEGAASASPKSGGRAPRM